MIPSLTAIAGPLPYTGLLAEVDRGAPGKALAGAPFPVSAAFCAVAWALVAGAGRADRTP